MTIRKEQRGQFMSPDLSVLPCSSVSWCGEYGQKEYRSHSEIQNSWATYAMCPHSGKNEISMHAQAMKYKWYKIGNSGWVKLLYLHW